MHGAEGRRSRHERRAVSYSTFAWPADRRACGHCVRAPLPLASVAACTRLRHDGLGSHPHLRLRELCRLAVAHRADRQAEPLLGVPLKERTPQGCAPRCRRKCRTGQMRRGRRRRTACGSTVRAQRVQPAQGGARQCRSAEPFCLQTCAKNSERHRCAQSAAVGHVRIGFDRSAVWQSRTARPTEPIERGVGLSRQV